MEEGLVEIGQGDVPMKVWEYVECDWPQLL